MSCILNAATGIDTCTAIVADASPPPLVTPTGKVAFSSGNGGVFSFGNTCGLTPTPSSPGVASCTVQYASPSSGSLAIAATYGGDDKHSGSRGQIGSFVGPLRTTATRVNCRYDPVVNSNTCTAQVADSSPPPVVTPIGVVKFTTKNGGSFPAGSACTLVQTPASPGVSSCSVQYVSPNAIPPAANVFPAVSAAYSGEKQHSASSGKTVPIVVSTGTEKPKKQDGGPLNPFACVGGVVITVPQNPQQTSCPAKDQAAKDLDINAVWAVVLTKLAAAVEDPAIKALLWLDAGTGELLSLADQTIVSDDPPDSGFRAIVLAHPAPYAAEYHMPRCAKLPAATCSRLRSLARRFVVARDRVRSLTEALTTTETLELTALRARDYEAATVQIAARKTYAGELAAAEIAAHGTDTALANLWPRLKGVPTLVDLAHLPSDRQLRDARNHLPPALRNVIAIPFPGWLLDAINPTGAPSARVNVPAMLKRPASNITLFNRDYHSMKLANLRALVSALARRKLITAAKANTLLGELACSRTHRHPDLRAFTGQLASMPSAYADLVRFAAGAFAGRRVTCAS